MSADASSATLEAEVAPWLSADQQYDWRALVALMMTLPAALDAQLKRDAGVNAFEFHVLASLSAAPNRTLVLSALADLAQGSLSRLSHVVNRLEAKGWALREPCPEDGRFTNAILTEDGYRKLAASAPGHVATVRQLVIDRLSRTQLGQLSAIGHRVLDANLNRD